MTRSAGTRVLAGLLALPLIAYAYLGLFSRYAADDYCTAGQLAVRGLLGLELQLYEAWSGRFAFTFLVGVVELIGAGATRVLPAIALLAWVAALTWAITQLGRLLGWIGGIAGALVLAEVIVLATLGSTADVGQSLYWQTGMLTYLAPLVLLACSVAVAAHQVCQAHASAGAMLVMGALAFLTAGTSETYVAVQVLGLLIALGLVRASGSPALRRVLLPLLLVALVGSLLGFAIVALAPGNAVRGGSGPRPPWSYIIGASLDDARQFIHDYWRFSTLSFLLALVLPAGWGLLWPARALAGHVSRALLWGLVIGLAGLALVVVSLMPSLYALSAPEPGRARIIPQLVLVCVTVMLGYLVGTSLALTRPVVALRPLAVGLVVLALIAPLLATRGTLAEVDQARAYAARWDGVDAQVRGDRAAGLQDVVVPPLEPTGTVRGMDFVGPDPSDWLNECVARYYGVRSIAARNG